jgi:hypothetical protein
MSRISTIKTVVTTLSVALGVGFIMQYDQAASTESEARSAAADSGAIRTLMMSTNAQGEAVFGVPDVVTTPLLHSQNVQTVVAVDAVYVEFAVPQMGTILATPIEGCNAEITAMPDVAAMVSLAVSVPCATNADFILRHNDLMFTARTDDEGDAVLTVPALTVDATFAVLFNNVEVARVSLDVPDVGMFDRAVLQWKGTHNLQLHALEAGALIGDPGHIWSASVHGAAQAIEGEQGFVVRLGTSDADVPHLAEVYTYPVGRASRDTLTVLQIGVAMTERNCGREVDVMTIQSNMGRSLVAQNISAALPSCDAIDGVVMLRDKFQDVTLALR